MNALATALPASMSAGAPRPRRGRIVPGGAPEAVTLRVAQAVARYGISSTGWYEHIARWEAEAAAGVPLAERRGLPSLRVPGRKGRKGTRLLRVAEVEAWLARWVVGGGA